MDASVRDIHASDRAWNAVMRRALRRARRAQLVRAFTTVTVIAAASILVVVSATSGEQGSQRGPQSDIGAPAGSSVVRSVLPLDGVPMGLAEGQDVVWVSVAGTQGSPSLLIALDLTTGKEVDRVETQEAFRQPVNVGGLVWGIVVRDEAEGTSLVALDPSTGELVHDLPGIASPLTSNGVSIWAVQDGVEGEGVVVEVDAASGVVLREVDLGTPIWTLVATPNRIWVGPMELGSRHGDVITIEVDPGTVEQIALPEALSVYQPVVGDGKVWIPAVDSAGTVKVHGFNEVTGQPTGSVLNTGASVPIAAYGDLLWTIDESGVVGTMSVLTGQFSIVAETAPLQQFSVWPSALVDSTSGAVWVASSEPSVIRVDVEAP
jgi:hypothetical protein